MAKHFIKILVSTEDVFQSREKLEHTPPSSKRATWQDTRLSDSIGPLSSTHVESPLRFSVDHRENEEVPVKLFSEKLSGRWIHNNHKISAITVVTNRCTAFKNKYYCEISIITVEWVQKLPLPVFC